MATTPGYSGMDWFNEEPRLIEVGKLYGYEQSELRTFVQYKLAELKDERAERSRIERDERAAERAHALMVLEMKAKERIVRRVRCWHVKIKRKNGGAEI